MSNKVGFLGGLLKGVAAAGETAIHAGVRGKKRDIAGCTPCAASAKASTIYEKNLKLMGQSQGGKSKKRAH